MWLVSHHVFASLIAFACVNDLLNSAVKWAVQRPRPSWYSAGSGLAAPRAWEKDLSFPSAHTQFFSGIAFCRCRCQTQCTALVLFTLYIQLAPHCVYSTGAVGLCQLPLSAAAAFGLITGLTRNYLGVHWCTDTLAGLALGLALGLVWGSFDPYARLARASSPLLAFSAATAVSGGLLALLVAIRRLVPARRLAVRRFWLVNALAAFEQPANDQAGGGQSFMRRQTRSEGRSDMPDDARDDDARGDDHFTTGLVRPTHLRVQSLTARDGRSLTTPPGGTALTRDIDSLFEQRSLTSKLPQLTTTWCVLSLAGLHAALGLSPATLACGSATRRAVQGLIGLSGLLLWRQLMKLVKRSLGLASAAHGRGTARARAALKTITYVGVCAWTFALAQKVSLAALAALACV